MSEKSNRKTGGGRTLLSVALAAVFVVAAFAIIAADDNSLLSADKDAYLGAGDPISGSVDFSTLLTGADTYEFDLTDDVTCTTKLTVSNGYNVTINLNEFDLTFTMASGSAIEVQSGGELTINSEGGALYFSFTSGSSNRGVFANGGTAAVNCDITASGAYFYAVCTDSTNGGTITVNGNINATGNSSLTIGVHALGGGTITVDGNVFVDGIEAWGVAVSGTNSKAFVTGDVTAIGNYSGGGAVGVSAQDSGNIIEVDGNVTVTNKGTAATYLGGVRALNAVSITIGGDVTFIGPNGWGVYSAYGAEVTVEGKIIVPAGNTEVWLKKDVSTDLKFPDDGVPVPGEDDHEGYWEYADHPSYVWLKMPATYTVTYKPGTGGAGEIETATKTHDIGLVLRGKTFTQTGYEQTGWSTTDGGTTNEYPFGTTYTANEPLTLFPVWTATYVVTVNGGDGAGNYKAGDTVNIAADEPAEGKVFDKWTATGIELTNPGDAETSFTMPAGAVTLTAEYKDAPKGGLDTMMIVVIAVIALGVIAAAAFFFFKK